MKTNLTYQRREVILVDQMDFTVDDEGKYKKEYWGKVIIDRNGSVFIIAEDGQQSSEIFNLRAFINENYMNMDIDNLMKLKDKFSTKDIIELRKNGII